MDVDKQTAALFFATLTVATQLFVVVAVGGAAVMRFAPRSRLAARVGAARNLIEADGLWAAALIATVTMLGSLYLSEVAHYPPCKLCWYQRIAMYPLSVILAIAAVTRDRAIARYVVPVTAIGGAISVYHYQLERFPSQHSLSCSLDVPCTTVWIWEFHYISIPMMALSAFAAIAALVTLARTPTDQSPPSSHSGALS
jgi:disulfide bond formation protein DsbB